MGQEGWLCWQQHQQQCNQCKHTPMHTLGHTTQVRHFSAGIFNVNMNCHGKDSLSSNSRVLDQLIGCRCGSVSCKSPVLMQCCIKAPCLSIEEVLRCSHSHHICALAMHSYKLLPDWPQKARILQLTKLQSLSLAAPFCRCGGQELCYGQVFTCAACK